MKRFSLVSVVLAGLVLVGFPQLLLAGSCYHAAPYVTYAAPVVKTVYAVKEVPVYVAAFTPVVSVGYVAPAVYTPPVVTAAPAMPQAMPQDPCAQLKERVAALERALQPPTQPQPQIQPNQSSVPAAPAQPSRSEPVPAPQSSSPQGAAAQPSNLTAATVIQNRCAECHTAGRLKGGFALAGEDGRLLLLTPEQIRKVLSSTKGKPGTPPKMPKGKPPLTDEEFAALLELVDQVN